METLEERRLPDGWALDAIASMLDGKEWSPSDLDRIADVLRSTGREVGDSEPSQD